ncbi:hypothetical protein Tco_1505911 [Tanacetum coccineum]
MTTVGTRAVVNKGKVENVLKKAKWVWRPKMNYQDHVYKYNGSYMLKKFEYVDPKGISKDCYEKRLIDVLKIHTDSNVADLLTKGFDVTRISMDLRMDRSSPGKYNSSMVFNSGSLYVNTGSLYVNSVRTLANGTQQLVASIDSKEYTITEASVRSKLQLADATGIHNLSDAEIYAGLATLGYVTEGDIIPLLPAMLAGVLVDQGEDSAQPAEPHHTPVDPIPSTSQPPHSPHPSPPHPSPLHQSPPHLSPLHHSPPQSPAHFSPPRSYDTPLPEGNTSGSAEDSMQLKQLMVLVPTLVTKINSLEKELKDTKQTLGTVVLKLVKKVKSLKTTLKRKSKKVLISKSESEEPEDQGRIIQDIDDDPLVSLVRESMKEKLTDFGVSKKKSTDKGKRYRRRARSMAKKIDTELDTKEEINTGIEEVITGSTKVNSGTTSKMGQREGKAPMVEEDVQATHKTKEQIRQEEAGLEEAIKLQAQLDEDVAKQIHLDKMLEANAEFIKDVLGKDLPEQDFAKRMLDMVNQRKKHFVEERAKAKKIKEEFDKLVQQIDTFVAINLKATKAKLKRYREELQTKTSKKQRFDDKDVLAIGEKVTEVKEEEPVKRTGKRKKKKARKGIDVDKSVQEDSETNKEESVEAMNPTPLTTTSDSVVNWKIFQQGQRSIYQIMRENGVDTVYMSFGAMVKDFIREDLIGLYRTMFDPPLNEDAIWSLPLQQKMVSWSKGILTQDDSIPDEQVHLSDDEDSRNDHLPKSNSRKDWWKPLPEEERPATPEPAWTIPSSIVSDIENNWASVLVSTYETPAENSLLAKTGDMMTFMNWYCRQVNKTKLTQADFEGQAYEVVKAFYPDVIHLQFQMEECHKILTDQVDWTNLEGDQVRINVNRPLPLSGPPGHGSSPALPISKMKAASYPNFGLELLKFYIDRHDSLSRRKDVRTHMRILSVVRIKAYSRYGNDYLSEIVLRRANLQEHIIAEKDFKNLYPSDFEDLNPGMNTRFWTQKDVTRSNEFIAAIERRLKTRRIYRNLECFVGGRVRDIDYRLLQRTE